MKASEIRKTNLSKEAILERLNDEEIFEKYFPAEHSPISIGRKYTNPFRRDKHPGCCFYIGKYGVRKGRLLFHDFATGISWDCFDIVMLKFDLNFWEALKKINEDFNLFLGTRYARSKIEKEIKEQEEVDKGPPLFQIIQKPFTDSELEYWSQFGITKSTLDKFNVKSVKAVYLNKRFTMRSTEKNPIFAYISDTGAMKIYRPLSPDKDGKWSGNFTKKDIHGWEQLPFEGDTLIITKSLKDVMCLYEMGYTAISPPAESTLISKPKIDSLKQYFNNIILLYDNDGTFNPTKTEAGKGLYGARRMSEKYDLRMVFLPKMGGSKDISDYYREHGRDAAIKWIKENLSKGITYGNYERIIQGEDERELPEFLIPNIGGALDYYKQINKRSSD